MQLRAHPSHEEGKLYLQNAMLFTHRSQISFLGRDEKGLFCRLHETIFQPEGAGQPYDLGSIKNLKGHIAQVLQVQKQIVPADEEKGEQQEPASFHVNHYISEDNELSLGEEVVLEVEEERRMRHMQLHTAGHIIQGIIKSLYQFKPLQYRLKDSRPYAGEAFIEFVMDGWLKNVDEETIQRGLKRDSNIPIENRCLVCIEFPKNIRTVSIDRLKHFPCEGTHVPNAQMIGAIDISSVKVKKRGDEKVLTIIYELGYIRFYKPFDSPD